MNLQQQFRPTGEHTLLKLGSDGSVHLLELQQGGVAVERDLFKPEQPWNGQYQLEQGQLQVTTGDWFFAVAPGQADQFGFLVGEATHKGQRYDAQYRVIVIG